MTLALLLAMTAWADPPAVDTHKRSAESEIIGQIRHDLLGRRVMPVYAYQRFDSQTGNTQIVGYLGVEGLYGLGDPQLDGPADLDLFSLHARRRAGQGEWVIGRQSATTLRRRQTFDGGRYWWRPRPGVAFDVWGGIARHQDLDDFRDGIGIARAAFSTGSGPLLIRAGAQVEAGAKTPWITRQDVEGRLTIGDVKPTTVEALVAVAEQPEPTLEWARVEVRPPTFGRFELILHAQRRQAADWESLFADRILLDLVGAPVDQVGLMTRVHGGSWSHLATSYRIVSYERLDDREWGHVVDVRYLSPPSQPLRLSPSYTFRSGPGGVVHTAFLTGTWRLDDDTTAVGRVAVVPYRRGHEPWSLATDIGVEGGRRLAGATTLRVTADLASDPVFKRDLRVGAALTVGWR